MHRKMTSLTSRTNKIDPGPLRSARRSASPATPDHLGGGGSGGGPHVSRALVGRRPASAHAGPAQHPPRQVDVRGASVEARHTRGWPFEDPFPLTLRSLPTQILRDLQNTSNDVTNVSSSRISPVPSIRQTNSSLAKVFGSDPYLPAKRPWANLYLEDSLDYSQVRDSSTESQWNVYNEISESNKHAPKDQPMTSVPLNWQFRTDVDQSTLIPQHVNQHSTGSAMTSCCPESCVKAPRDYEALIRNMDEVEEREINACLREDFYSRVGDVGDWSEDSVRVDTVMLENFEELEQLIQEEDDDVQMALRIQDEKFPHQRRKKTNEYLESQKPVYQGNTDHDESDDDLSPEVAAAMMHSEEQGILMGSAPSRVYNALFSDCEKDLIAVSSACPFHPQSVVVPTAGGEIPYTASAEDLTALASVALGEEPPNGSVFSDTLKKRGSYDAVMIEASKPYTDEQIADSPNGTPLASAPLVNLEYVLDPASPPSHFSKVQLRGSILPDWFPGYYKALPHIKGITAVCSNPGIVMEDAWWTLQTTIA